MAEIYDTFPLLWNNSPWMKLLPLLRVASSSLPALLPAAPTLAQRRPPIRRRAPARRTSQFILGRHLETADNIPSAIAAFKRGIQLDPQAADIVAELAGLYMRQSRLEEAVQPASRR